MTMTSSLPRCEERDQLPRVSAIVGEVRVEREDPTVAVQFTQPNQTRISQRHRRVRVTFHKRLQRRSFCLQVERDLKCPAMEKTQNVGRFATVALREETGFAEHRFASQKRRSQAGELLHRPRMPLVAIAQIRDEGPRIEQGRNHFP